MFRRLILAAGGLLLLLSSCQSAPPAAPQEPAQALPYVLIPPDPAGTPTPTPFQPDYGSAPREVKPSPMPTATITLTPLLTSTPSQTPVPPTQTYAAPTAGNYVPATPNFYGDVWENYPAPAVYPASTQISYPVGMITQPQNQLNILLLGSDIRPNSSDFRTDTIILMTVNKDLGTVHLTSIPRDLFVYIPGWTVQRINTAMNYGGYETLAMTLAYNFGVYPDHYVMVNFSNFIEIINSLGGIEVEVGEDFSDQRTGYDWYQVKKGTVHMDGDTALWYVRSRYTSSDIDRLRRAQEVIQAIGYRLLSFDALTRSNELYEIYKDSVQTDLGLWDISDLLPAAKILINTQKIDRTAIGYDMLYDWVEPYTGAMVLIPNRYAIRQLMYEILNSR
jgi:LCP family protein required for cell wall assembly